MSLSLALRRAWRDPVRRGSGVEIVHEFRRGVVVHFPQCGDDLVRAGVEECPGESDQSLTRVRARARAVATGDGHEAERAVSV